MTATCMLCDVELHRIADEQSDEYVWADAAGKRFGTDKDLAHIPDPYAHLAALGESMDRASKAAKRKGVELTWVYWARAREYSSLMVRLDAKGTFHEHQAQNRPAYTGTVQYCCGWPMWLRPSGWHCRRSCGKVLQHA